MNLKAPEIDELVRRINAAAGYAGMNKTQLADEMRQDRKKLWRLTGRKRMNEIEMIGLVDMVAEATGVPASWFERLDLSLPELIEAGLPPHEDVEFETEFDLAKRGAPEALEGRRRRGKETGADHGD